MHIPISEHVTELEAALGTLHKYTTELLDQRRKTPHDDFLSALITAESMEGRLSPEELVWGVVDLMMAGMDTTKSQFTSIAHDIAAHGLWQRVSDDLTEVPNTVSEVVRTRPMPQMLRRLAAEDLELAGTFVPSGTEIDINLVAAGRDPLVYAEPDRFDIDRPTPIFPIIFGGGMHHCIGHALASAELRIGLEVLTQHMANPRVVDVAQKPWGGMMGGFDSVEFEFTPKRGPA